MTPTTWAIIAGGGTAGHVLPAIAVGQALVAAGHDPDTIHFVGSARGVEGDLVPEAGFALTALPGRGIQRRLTVANVAAGWGIVRATATAMKLVRHRRPKVVLSVGGYASVACSLAARTLNIPVVVHEQNAVAGAANRVVGRFAKACAVSFPDTDLPRAVVTGNPVRAEILAIDRSRDRVDARKRLGVPEDRTLVGVFGGSLGATRINRATIEAVRMWADRGDLAVRHVLGRRDWPMASAERVEMDSNSDSALVYEPVEYESRMDQLLAAADVMVCRSGATTVAELAAVGVPSILVPLPGAPRDHQTMNARRLESAGGAVVVADEELDGPRLVAEVDGLVADPEGLQSMGRAVVACAHRDAAARVAELVEQCAVEDMGR